MLLKLPRTLTPTMPINEHALTLVSIDAAAARP
jgi:hypothetical protein